jgi:hypothetical protein
MIVRTEMRSKPQYCCHPLRMIQQWGEDQRYGVCTGCGTPVVKINGVWRLPASASLPARA